MHAYICMYMTYIYGLININVFKQKIYVCLLHLLSFMFCLMNWWFDPLAFNMFHVQCCRPLFKTVLGHERNQSNRIECHQSLVIGGETPKALKFKSHLVARKSTKKISALEKKTLTPREMCIIQKEKKNRVTFLYSMINPFSNKKSVVILDLHCWLAVAYISWLVFKFRPLTLAPLRQNLQPI